MTDNPTTCMSIGCSGVNATAPYFVQQWFNLSDPGVEEALYESPVLQRFVGVDLGAAPAPDETTICRFRHLLEKHDLCGMMLDAVNLHLEAKGSRSRPARSSCHRQLKIPHFAAFEYSPG